jgi:hypothetical protein
LPVLAHPGVYEGVIDPVRAIHQAKAEGVEGLEVHYPYDDGHRAATDRGRWIGRAQNLARELGLLQSGGSDFHGRPGEVIDVGDMGLTGPQFAKFKQGWQQLRSNPA